MSDSKQPWPGPPAGVSSLDEGGKRTSVEGTLKPKAGRRRQVGEDVLRNVEKLQAVSSNAGMTPSGTKAVKTDIRIGNMPKTRRSQRNHTTFLSIDGDEYTFRTHDTKGKQLEYLPTQVLYICLRELSLGGSALPILQAFNVNFPDESGKAFLPVPGKTFSRLQDLPEQEEDEQASLALGQLE